MPKERFSRSASLGLFLLFVCCAIRLPLQAQEAVDPFYEKLFQDGQYFYKEANYAEAIKNFEIAFFGFIDHPDHLAQCYAYLTVSHYLQKNLDRSRYFVDEIKHLNLVDRLNSASLPDGLFHKYTEVVSYFVGTDSRSRPSHLPPSPPSTAQKSPLPGASASAAHASLESEIRQLKEAIKKDRENSDPYLTLSALYSGQKKMGLAKSTLKDLIKVRPNSGNAHFELGKILLAEKKPKEAVAYFRKAAALLPEDVEILFQTGKLLYELREFEGSVQKFLELKSLAQDYKNTEGYLAALDKFDQDIKARAEALADRARRAKTFKEKVALYKKALEADSTNLTVALELSSFYQAAKMHDEAAELLEKIRKHQPRDIRLLAALGSAYVAAESFAKAVPVLRQAESAAPVDPEISYMLAKALMGQKKYREAADAFRRAIGGSPEYKDSGRLLRLCEQKIAKG